MINYKNILLGTLFATIVSHTYEHMCSKINHDKKIFHQALIILGSIVIVLNIHDV